MCQAVTKVYKCGHPDLPEIKHRCPASGFRMCKEKTDTEVDIADKTCEMCHPGGRQERVYD